MENGNRIMQCQIAHNNISNGASRNSKPPKPVVYYYKTHISQFTRHVSLHLFQCDSAIESTTLLFFFCKDRPILIARRVLRWLAVVYVHRTCAMCDVCIMFCACGCIFTVWRLVIILYDQRSRYITVCDWLGLPVRGECRAAVFCL